MKQLKQTILQSNQDEATKQSLITMMDELQQKLRDVLEFNGK